MEREQALAQLSRFVVTLRAHQSFEVSVPHLSHGTLLLLLHPFSSQTVCVSARQRSSPAEGTSCVQNKTPTGTNTARNPEGFAALGF